MFVQQTSHWVNAPTLIMDASVLWRCNAKFMNKLENSVPNQWTSLIRDELVRIQIDRNRTLVMVVVGPSFKPLASSMLLKIAKCVKSRKRLPELPIPMNVGEACSSANGRIVVVPTLTGKDVLQTIVYQAAQCDSALDVACPDPTILMMSPLVRRVQVHPLNTGLCYTRGFELTRQAVCMYALLFLYPVYGMPSSLVGRLKSSMKEDIVDDKVSSLMFSTSNAMSLVSGELQIGDICGAFTRFAVHNETAKREPYDLQTCVDTWIRRINYLEGSWCQPVHCYNHLKGFHSGQTAFTADFKSYIVKLPANPPVNVRRGVRKQKLRERRRYDLIPTRTTMFRSRVVGTDAQDRYRSFVHYNRYEALAFPDMVVKRLGTQTMVKRSVKAVTVFCERCDAFRVEKHTCSKKCTLCLKRHPMTYNCVKCDSCAFYKDGRSPDKHNCAKLARKSNRDNTKTSGQSQKRRIASGIVGDTKRQKEDSQKKDPRVARKEELKTSGPKRSGARCIGPIPSDRWLFVALVQEKRRAFYQKLSDHVSSLSDQDFGSLANLSMLDNQNGVMKCLRQRGKRLSDNEASRPNMEAGLNDFAEGVRSMFGTNLRECIKRAFLQLEGTVDGVNYLNIRHARTCFAEKYPDIPLVALVPQPSNTPHSNPEPGRPLKCLASYVIAKGFCGKCPLDQCTCVAGSLSENDTSDLVSIVYGLRLGKLHSEHLYRREEACSVAPLGTVVVRDCHLYLMDDTVALGYELPKRSDESIKNFKTEGAIPGLSVDSFIREGKQGPGCTTEGTKGFRDRVLYMDELVEVYSVMRYRVRHSVIVTVDEGRSDAMLLFGYIRRLMYDSSSGTCNIPTRKMRIGLNSFRSHSHEMKTYVSREQRLQSERREALDTSFWVATMTMGEAYELRVRRNIAIQRRDTDIVMRITNKAREWYRGKHSDIIIVYGDSGPGHEQKKITGFGSGLLSLLTRHFTVVMMDEFRTSAVCPFCHSNRVGRYVATGIHVAFKHIECDCRSLVPGSTRQSTIVQRDLRACYNMLRNVIDIIVTGRVSDIFLRISERPRDKSRVV